MASYWIGDDSGRVLGPLTLTALRDLVGSGRLRTASRASRDGRQWVPLREFTEIADLFTAPPAAPQGDPAQVDRLRALLRAMQTQSAHELYGVRPEASLPEL